MSSRRFVSQVHAQTLARDLGVHQESLREAHDARRSAVLEAERTQEALRQEQEMSTALRLHNESLQREKESMQGELERAHGQLRAAKREVEIVTARWEQTASEAGEWAQRAYEAQTASRQALAEANESRLASSAMQRSMLTAQEYRLAEEAGYTMQTIIQLAPSKRIVTPVQVDAPQLSDAWMQM